MFINKKYVDIAVNYTDEKRKAQGVSFDEEVLGRYKARLKNLAQEKNIREGRDLDWRDWSWIKGELIHLMEDSTGGVINKDEDFRRNVKADKYIYAALNNLIAITSRELGSPEIPVDDFRPHFRLWAKNIILAKPMEENNSLDETFDNQRGINAFDLMGDRIQPLLDDIASKKNVSENVGKLYAEYQALVKRQANHGFFWRLFHPTENSDRNAIIKDLEVALKKYAPNLSLSSKDPLSINEVIRSAEEYQAVSDVNAGVNLYSYDVPSTFGYSGDVLNEISNKAQPEVDNNIIAQSSNIIAEGEDNRVENNNVENNNVENNNVENNNVENNEIKANDEVKVEAPNQEIVNEENVKEENKPVAEIKKEAKVNRVSATATFNNLNGYAFQTELEKEIWDVIKGHVSYRVNSVYVVPRVLNTLFSAARRVNKAYDSVIEVDGNAEKINGLIHDTMSSAFSDIFDSLNGCNMNVRDQVVVAQQLCDLILNKATVVGFNGEEYSKFAENYALKNGHIVTEHLAETRKGLTAEAIDEVLENARNELNVKVNEEPKIDVVDNAPLNVEEIKAEPEIKEENASEIKAEEEIPAEEKQEEIVVENEPELQNEEIENGQPEEKIEIEESEPAVAEPVATEPAINVPAEPQPEVNNTVITEEKAQPKPAEESKDTADQNGASETVEEIKPVSNAEKLRDAERNLWLVNQHLMYLSTLPEDHKYPSKRGFFKVREFPAVNVAEEIQKIKQEKVGLEKQVDDLKPLVPEEERLPANMVNITNEQRLKKVIRKRGKSSKNKELDPEIQKFRFSVGAAARVANKIFKLQTTLPKNIVVTDEKKKLFNKDAELKKSGAVAEADNEDKTVYNVQEVTLAGNKKSHLLTVNKLHQKLNDRTLKNEVLENKTLSAVRDIMQAVGVNESLESISNGVNLYGKDIMSSAPGMGGETFEVGKLATAFFDECYSRLVMDEELPELSKKDMIIAAQRISNLMLKNYSPLAFVSEELDQYTNSYVTNNSDVFKTWLAAKGTFEKDEIESLMQEFEKTPVKDLRERPARDTRELEVYTPTYYKKFKKRFNDERFNEKVKNTIIDVIRASGVDADIDIDETVYNIFDSGTKEFSSSYDPYFYKEKKGIADIKLADITKSIFNATYDWLTNAELPTRNAIITAQRITDIILRSYSPLAFESFRPNSFADRYIISDKNDLEECLNACGLSAEEIEDVMKRDLLEEFAQELAAGSIGLEEPMEEIEANEPEDEVQPVDNNLEEQKKLEEEKQRQLEEQRKLEEERQRQLEEEAKKKADEEARIKAEEEAKQRQLEEERKLEEEKQRKLEEEKQRQLEEEKQRQLEQRQKEKEKAPTNQVSAPILEYVKNYSYESLHSSQSVEEKDSQVKAEIGVALRNLKSNDDSADYVAASLGDIKTSIMEAAKACNAKDVQNEADAISAMEKIVIAAFKESYRTLDIYSVGNTTAERMRMTQAVADIVLENYSPVAIAKGAMDAYANKYVITRADPTNEILKNYITDDKHRRDIVFRMTGHLDKASQEEADRRAAEEAKKKAEQEAARKKAEEEAKKKAEEEAKRKAAEEEAKRKAEEERIKREEEEKAKRKEASQKNAIERKQKAEADPVAEAARKLAVQKSVEKAIADGKTVDTNAQLKDKCKAAVDNRNLTNSIKTQLAALAGSDSSAKREFVEKVSVLPYRIILPVYENADMHKKNINSIQTMTAMARDVFREVYKRSIECRYDLYDGIYVAQEMTDLLLRTYSPAAFVPKVFDTLADYHVFLRPGILEGEIRKYKPGYTIRSKDNDKTKDDRAKMVAAGYNKNTQDGPLDYYKQRKMAREKDTYFDKNKAICENVLDSENVTAEDIQAYQIQYVIRSGDRDGLPKIKSKAEEIFKKIGVQNPDAESEEFFNNIFYDMQKVYDNMQHFASCDGTFGDMMTYTSMEVFQRTYDNLEKYGLHGARQIAMAQQLADIILDNYSPASFNETQKGNYTKNFVIGNVANLKYVLDKNDLKLSDAELNKLMDSVARANEHLEEAPGADTPDPLAELKKLNEEKRIEEKARELMAQRKLEEQKKREEEAARRKAEKEEAEIKAAEEAKRKAEEEAEKIKAEELAKIYAEEQEAKRKAKEAEEKRRAAIKYEPKAVEKYERKANRMQMNETELMGPDSIDFAIKECKLSFEDSKLTEYVKSQIGKILLEGGAEQYKIQETVDKLFNKLSGENGMLKLYTRAQYNMFKTAGGHQYNQKEFMDTIMNRTVEYFGADAVACFASVEQGLVANQKIMELITKNYSPVPFTTGGTLEKHANDYLFKDNGVAYLKSYYDRYRYQTEMSRFKNEEDFIAKVSATMEKANKQNLEKDSLVKEDKNSKREKIAIDLSKIEAEAPKTNAPKTEAPKPAVSKVEETNPLVERLVIKELSEKVEVTKVSAKVNEHDAPVTSKSKE